MGDTKWAAGASYSKQMSLDTRVADPGSWLAAARAGDAAAFEELLAPILLPAYKLAFTMLAQREAAEDAVQDASFKAWKAVGTLRAEGGDVRPWFLSIVANQCRTARRRQWWRLLTSSDRTEEAPSQAGQHAEAQTAEAIDLRRAVASLSREKRLVLALVYWLDLPIDEVARVLGVSEVAVRSRLRRAVLALRSDYSRAERDGAGAATASGFADSKQVEEMR
jgi:RNA polymerase sigma-70 factor (ECF subfamily)